MSLVIKKIMRIIIFDLSWLNILLFLKFKTFKLPLLIYRSVHFRMGKGSKILNNKGRLRLGCKWDISGYKQSELKICDKATLEINGDMRIYTGCSIDICPGATLSLGSGYINNNARIVAFNRINIGNGVAISENVTFRDSDNHSIEGSQKPISAPIIIEDYVWIGINVTILKGVKVGEGAVIAANSLVNRDVPPRTLVAGVPARVVKDNIKWK